VVEIHEHNHVMIERYEEIMTRIGQKPRNEEELAALKEFMAKSKEDIARIMTEAAQVGGKLGSFILMLTPFTTPEDGACGGIVIRPTPADAFALLLCALCEQVREQIDLLGEFRYEIPVEEKYLAWSLIEYPRKIEAAAKDAEERLEDDKVSNRALLRCMTATMHTLLAGG
jgi:hypothetical protein